MPFPKSINTNRNAITSWNLNTACRFPFLHWYLLHYPKIPTLLDYIPGTCWRMDQLKFCINNMQNTEKFIAWIKFRTLMISHNISCSCCHKVKLWSSLMLGFFLGAGGSSIIIIHLRECWKVLSPAHFSKSVFWCLVIEILIFGSYIRLKTSKDGFNRDGQTTSSLRVIIYA